VRLTRLSLGALALFLLIVVPVNAAPALHKGSQTSYDLSVSISFLQSCLPILSSTVRGGIVCPMFTMIPLGLKINGTLKWAVTDLNATTAILNVTRDITTSGGEIVTPVSHHTGSFIESIDMATRIASVLPFIEPEMDQALQMAQTNMATALPTGTSWSSTMSAVDDTGIRQPLHTMWWVNGPLKVNNTIPVLVFPTNVTGSTSVDVGGSVGSRSAWTLAFNKSRSLPFPDQLVSLTASIPFADNFEFALTFNYDQTSDLLLSASADIHLGFGEEELIPPPPCASPATIAPALTVCPDTPVPILREFGIDLQASLRLSTTTLDLTQRLTSTSGSDPNGGSSSGSGPATGPGPGPGSGPGAGPGSGPNSGPNSGSGGGYNPGSGSTTTGAGQPASTPAQSKPAAQSASLLPWMYGILGIIAAAIVASAVWIARRRTKKATSQVGTVQLSA
jgi:hypothetical protein